MPVTFRYGLTTGALIGFVHAVLVKRIRPLFIHTAVIGLSGGLGLCYHDFKIMIENT